jgi:hypothetical protein
VSTHQDLSGLFVARSVQLYLKAGCRFGFVMPLAALSRRQFTGFRDGEYPAAAEPATVLFDEPWNLDGISPHPFPVPASVVFGTRGEGGESRGMPTTVQEWVGHLTDRNASWEDAEPLIALSDGVVAVADGQPASPYRDRFAQGASVVPRLLFLVEDAPTSPLGAGAGRTAVRSRRSNLERQPWSGLPSMEGVVESQFVRELHLGATLLHYRLLDPVQAIIPHDGKQLLGTGTRMAFYPGLADWWHRAEGVWEANRSANTRLSLIEQLDYRSKASNQFPVAPERVVYSKAGSYLAASRLSGSTAIVDDSLYWSAVSSSDEGRYLVAILNSSTMLNRVAPYQARGAFGRRHFDLYPFYIPVPLYDATSDQHKEIVRLASRAEDAASAVVLDPTQDFRAARAAVRDALAGDGVSAEIDGRVEELLSGQSAASDGQLSE